jgi:hypothetical protein
MSVYVFVGYIMTVMNKMSGKNILIGVGFYCRFAA